MTEGWPIEKPSSAEEENPDDILKIKVDLGNDDDLALENLNQNIAKKKISRCMCRHNQKAKMRWDLMIILLALYNCLSIPYEVCYGSSFTDSVGLDVFEYTIDVLFYLDIVINFWTTFVSKTGTEVTSGLKVAFWYVFYGRFFIDLGASLPLELIVVVILRKELTGGLKFLGLLKLVWLLRLGRIITYLKIKSNYKTGFKIF